MNNREKLQRYLESRKVVNREEYCKEHGITAKEFCLLICNIRNQSGLNVKQKSIYVLE